MDYYRVHPVAREFEPSAIGKELENGRRTEPQTCAQNPLGKKEFGAFERECMRSWVHRKQKEVREKKRHKYL
jgi:hypothetical protein